MLIEHYFPEALSPARLDKYLAGGWFRSAHMMYRSQLICLEGQIFSPVNIRARLHDYEFSKSLRKLLRQNKKTFRVIIRKAFWSEEKERLYQVYKPRFQGFVVNSLKNFLFATPEDYRIFDTYEVCVYDKHQLVAVSFFDLGKQSIASLLGLHNWEYRKYSLGIFSMLLEIEYGMQIGKKYYYPGYILDQPSTFDYKRRIGHLQYYNWKGRWRKISNMSQEEFAAGTMRRKIDYVKEYFQIFNIDYQARLYPLFSLGYSSFLGEQFLESPLHFVVAEGKDRLWVVEYLPETDRYRLSLSQPCVAYLDFILMNMEYSSDILDSPDYCTDLLQYNEIICESDNLLEVMEQVLQLQEQQSFLD